jgi:hypothetical protein
VCGGGGDDGGPNLDGGCGCVKASSSDGDERVDVGSVRQKTARRIERRRTCGDVCVIDRNVECVMRLSVWRCRQRGEKKRRVSGREHLT